MSQGKRRMLILATLVVVGTTAVTGLWLAYSAAQCALEAERTLHACRMVLDLIAVHVEKTSGQWPRSWDDLRELTCANESCGWKWPRDLDDIRKRIRVDFSLTCIDVAKQAPDSFQAVEQIGPNYGRLGVQENRLLTICREFCDKHAGKGASSSRAEQPSK
jgi:hypothetical protein